MKKIDFNTKNPQNLKKILYFVEPLRLKYSISSVGTGVQHLTIVAKNVTNYFISEKQPFYDLKLMF